MAPAVVVVVVFVGLVFFALALTSLLPADR